MIYCAAAIAGIAALTIVMPSALAMQFKPIALDDGVHVVIAAIGPIVQGDMTRLAAVLNSLPPSARVTGFALDSPGGSLDEADRFANFIQQTRGTVAVLSGAQCSSACFLVFAAGASKLAAPDALIGVHSASAAGQETIGSMAVTTAMAREAATLGVPATIIGKMVETNPNRMEWLTPYDLASMGVVMLRSDLQATSKPSPPPPNATPSTPPSKWSLDDLPRSLPPSATPPIPPQGSATAITPQSNEPPDFLQGLADRRSWEQWYASLSGDYQQGAFFWSAHRSDHHPPSCYLQGQNIGDWTAGCLAAEQRLARSDVQRKSDPLYRQGWNSY